MAKNNTPTEDDLQAEMLLKEADEALHQEKMEALWKEWGQTIVGIALMIVFGTMLGVGWKNWRHNVHSTQTQTFHRCCPNQLESASITIVNSVCL